jgi:DMSO/TMAO reductase YedYZ molybdopterin-dependent catalytic subunit
MSAQVPAKRGMIVRSRRPEDLEMPLDGFSEWITPIDRFFVRTHVYTPQVELASWKFQVEGEVEKQLTFSMDELKRLPRTELVGVLECAGNGRSFYRPRVIGLQWGHGAVGNGRWAGVRLAEVLRRAGVKRAAHEVLFEGADAPIGTMPDFQRSLPIKKALHPDTLLAYEMNGAPLPALHGFPLRVVAPGWAGDSWVKWVTRIRVLDREADTFWMKTAYRHPGRPVPPGVAVDPAEMRPVTSLAVKSVIAAPVSGFETGLEPVRVRGAAWSESPVTQVEVSTDRGRTWLPATLGKEQSRYAWRLWEMSWTPKQPGHYLLMARARDASGASQPLEPEWNPSGYGWNVIQRVPVIVGEKPVQASGRAAERSAATPPASYRTTCLTCHENDVVEQQRLTRTQWEREIDKMVKWGAPVRADQRTEILDYLAREFGPDW